MAIQEFIYDIRHAAHEPGSNRYTFRFPEAIRNLDQQLSLGVRSIKMVKALLEISLQIKIEAAPERFGDNATVMNCDTYLSLNSNESMNDFNLKLDHNSQRLFNFYRELVYEERYLTASVLDGQGAPIIPKTKMVFTSNDFDMVYRNKSSTFVIQIGVELQNRYFDINNSEYNGNISQDVANLLKIPVSFFHDLQQIEAGRQVFLEFIANYPKVTISFLDGSDSEQDIRQGHTQPYKFVFRNVWNREELLVKSSLTGLFNEQYLGFTNTQFGPLKIYPMTYIDQTFWIDLYDMHNKTKVEQQADDLLYLETVIIANTPQFV
jgi:hypothetical protein